MSDRKGNNELVFEEKNFDFNLRLGRVFLSVYLLGDRDPYSEALE